MDRRVVSLVRAMVFRTFVNVLFVGTVLGPVQAQNRNRNWLGYNNWITFGSGAATNALNVDSASVGASFSDTNGQLLVYTSSYGAGVDLSGIRGADHQLIPNQPSQWSLLNSMSNVQGNIFVPRPGHPDQAFLCTWYCNNLPGSIARRMGILSLDLGTGASGPAVLDTGFTWFMSNATCKRLVVPHMNGVDYWFVGQPIGGNSFNAFAITTDGVIGSPVVSQAGATMPTDWIYGKMVPSSSGDRFVSVMEKLNYSWNDTTAAIAELFHFDRQTGGIEHEISLPNLRMVKGAEFSPNGRYLYIAEYSTPVGSTTPVKRDLYQYDLEADDIPASRTLLHSYLPAFGVYAGTANVLALAPDGRIYVAQEMFEDALGVINEPNSAAPSCAYEYGAFAIPWMWLNLPAPIKDYHDDPGLSASLRENTAVTVLRVLPNPASDAIILQGMPANAGHTVVRDLLGHAVHVEKSHPAWLELGALPIGAYTIEVQDGFGHRLGLARFMKD